MACGSEGQRTRRSTGAGAKKARALGSYGMHLLLWLMSTIGEFFGMIAPGFIQVLIG